jgi:cytochrome P450
MKDYTFANGITVPKGSTIKTPLAPVHMDDSIHENAKEFDGFRFSRLREQDGNNAKYSAVNTSHEFLHFGHGHHAWYSLQGNNILMIVLEDSLQ